MKEKSHIHEMSTSEINMVSGASSWQQDAAQIGFTVAYVAAAAYVGYYAAGSANGWGYGNTQKRY
ncbi:hypothetical protein [Vibrio cholerae]|uniref:hypothetical protein n=1 Tax=Vibrio cholerae TaxID=666 RepID=UPI0030801D21